MKNFEKSLHEFTEEELQQKINQADPRYGILASYELQRRAQEKNTGQISNLIKEVNKLKEIVDLNANTSTQNTKNSNLLAKVAIWVSSVGILVQVIFSVTQVVRCQFTLWDSEDAKYFYYKNKECQRELNIGLLGTYRISVENFTSSLRKE